MTFVSLLKTFVLQHIVKLDEGWDVLGDTMVLLKPLTILNKNNNIFQTSDAQTGPPQYILPESSQQQQSPEECSSEDKEDDNLVKGDMEGEGDSHTNPASCSPLIGGAQVSRDMDETDDLEDSR